MSRRVFFNDFMASSFYFIQLYTFVITVSGWLDAH